MASYLKLILDWSEVWAPLIVIIVFLLNRNQPRYMTPVVVYFFLALIINLIGDVISDFKKHLPSWMQSNNPLYNIHSLIRFICYSLFFISLRLPKLSTVYKILPLISILIFVLNFSLIDDFFNYWHFSGNLLTGEAYLLLIYCMLYYVVKLNDDNLVMTDEPDFFVVTGLGIYVVVNFFVFLFYVPMMNVNQDLAENIWDVHNYAYIALSILTAKALYDAPRYQYSV